MPPTPGRESSEVASGHYNNSHRAFIQAFMAHSTLTFSEAKPILAAVMTAQGMLSVLRHLRHGERVG
jgi:hypothetical protein